MVDVTRLEFRTFEDFKHCFRGADFEVVPLSPAPFSGRSIITTLGRVLLSAGHFKGDIRSRGMILRFAGIYRRYYGETPSQTLVRGRNRVI
jgi:hypothetical protein